MTNQKIKELESAFAQSVENLTKAFEGLKAEIIKVDKSALEVEPLKVGDKVKFIGERNDFNNDVTNGKIYKISEVDGDGDFLFEDDRELGAKIGSFISPSTRHLFQLVEEEPVKVKSANEQRAELIQKAREFVEEKKNITGGLTGRSGYDFNYSICDADFKVNVEKRTVVCLLRGQIGRFIESKGIAKCMQGEVLNADIGKAISLAKALEIGVPSDFMYAVQPDEVVVGQITIDSLNHNTAKVTSEECSLINHVYRDNGRNVNKKFLTIIDDTNAVYADDTK